MRTEEARVGMRVRVRDEVPRFGGACGEVLRVDADGYYPILVQMDDGWLVAMDAVEVEREEAV